MKKSDKSKSIPSTNPQPVAVVPQPDIDIISSPDSVGPEAAQRVAAEIAAVDLEHTPQLNADVSVATYIAIASVPSIKAHMPALASR